MTGRLLSSWRGVAAAAAIVALLASCTPVKAGNAAIVGDATLSEAALNDTGEEILAQLAAADVELGVSAAQMNEQIINWWVMGEIVTEMAEREGVTVTQSQVDEFLAQFTDEDLVQIAATAGVSESTIEGAVRTQLLLQPIAEGLVPGGTPEEINAALTAAVGEMAAELGTSVNPRYGSFNPETGQVGPRDPERLSSPAQPIEEPGQPLAPTG